MAEVEEQNLDQREREDQQAGRPRQEQGEQNKPEDRKPRFSPRRKKKIRFILLALAVVALIVTIPIYAYYSARESTDDAQVDGHIIPVSPRIAGTIIQVLVSDNEEVKAGQELVRLDPADYQVALAQAEAQLNTSQANTVESHENVPITTINTSSQLSTSETQVQQEQASVGSAEQAADTARARLNSANAAVTQAEANYVKAQKDLVRYKDLVEKDEISKQDYDTAVAAADANRAQVESARAEVIAAQHSVDQAQAEVAVAKARLGTAIVQRRQSELVRERQNAVSEARFQQAQSQYKQRQADLDQAKLNLGYTVIRASVDGIVSRKTAEPGEQVSPGQQIMALVPLDDVWVTANYKETQIEKMRVGQKVEIESDTYGSSEKYNGYIDSIAAASGARFSLLPPENATGNYVKVVQRIPVKIMLEPGENRRHLLRPGMSVTPTVLLNSGTNNAY